MKKFLTGFAFAVLLCGWVLDPVYGFLAAGIGSGLADLLSGYVTYVINSRDMGCDRSTSDGSYIRRCAVENNVTLFTSLDTVRVLLDVLEETTLSISTIDA